MNYCILLDVLTTVVPKVMFYILDFKQQSSKNIGITCRKQKCGSVFGREIDAFSSVCSMY